MRKIYKMMSLVAVTLLTMTACQEIDDVIDQTPTTNSDNIAKSRTVIGSYFASISVNSYYYQGYDDWKYYAYLYEDANSTEPIQEVIFKNNYFKFTGLNPDTKYYYKVLFDIKSPSYHKESSLMSFTTLPGVSCGDVTYIDWEGNTNPFEPQNYEEKVNCLFGSSSTAGTTRNSYIYYTEEGWKMGHLIDAGYFNRMYLAYPTSHFDNTKKIWVNTSEGAKVPYLYGNASLDTEKYQYSLNMTHATARVVFNIDIDPEIDLPSVEINVMKLISNGVIPVSGYISMEDGKISSESYNEINLGGKITLKKGTPYHTTFYPLPASNEGNVTFYMHVNGASVLNQSLNLSGKDKWEAGKTYAYDIIYTPKELRITSVNVTDWNDMNGGNITIIH